MLCKYGASLPNVRQGTPPVHCDLKQSPPYCCSSKVDLMNCLKFNRNRSRGLLPLGELGTLKPDRYSCSDPCHADRLRSLVCGVGVLFTVLLLRRWPPALRGRCQATFCTTLFYLFFLISSYLWALACSDASTFFAVHAAAVSSIAASSLPSASLLLLGVDRDSLNPKYAQPRNSFELIYSLN